MNAEATVFVIDDDAAVRDALTRLLTAAGHAVESYANAEAFLAACDTDRPGCLVLDMQMPGMNGLELQSAFIERRLRLPIIFLTGHGTVSTAVHALNRGAFDFLEKPVEGGKLLARVGAALRADAGQRRAAAARNALLARCATLTARERELLPLVAAGRSSKDIARQLGISHRTVELHRGRIMQKMDARTVVELAGIAQTCESAGAAPDGDIVHSPQE